MPLSFYTEACLVRLDQEIVSYLELCFCQLGWDRELLYYNNHVRSLKKQTQFQIMFSQLGWDREVLYYNQVREGPLHHTSRRRNCPLSLEDACYDDKRQQFFVPKYFLTDGLLDPFF